MDKFWTSLLALCMLLHHTMSNTMELIRVVGESATFLIHDTRGGEAAVWSFGSNPIVTVSFKDPSQLIFLKDKFRTRFTISEMGRALSISKLRLKDSGTYSVNINGKISTFTLRVYSELAEPTVTCEAQNCSGESCSISLSCSTSGTGLGNVSYTWRVGNHSKTWEESSVVLQVNKSSSSEPLTCTAQNLVSNRSVTVTTSSVVCSEISTRPPDLGAHSSSSGRIWIMAGLGVALLLGPLLLLWKSTGWRKLLCTKSTPTDPVSASNTVYAEHASNGIKPKLGDGEPSTTIYSLVKRPDQLLEQNLTPRQTEEDSQMFIFPMESWNSRSWKSPPGLGLTLVPLTKGFPGHLQGQAVPNCSLFVRKIVRKIFFLVWSIHFFFVCKTAYL
ncbi:SLAM family member 6 isoform X2 [Cinclus cinclus]|uniref:SLAM family member 6 isoform X2 n=1 Tax=Cinclus cinclus TaxID=127875 RepID=UPI002E0E5C24